MIYYKIQNRLGGTPCIFQLIGRNVFLAAHALSYVLRGLLPSSGQEQSWTNRFALAVGSVFISAIPVQSKSSPAKAAEIFCTIL